MKTLREYIIEADQKKVAIGHFNISNLEALHGIFNAARSLELPIVIGVSEGERDFVGVAEVAALVKTLREKYEYPIFLNADHTYSFEKVKEVIDAGFDAAIFDGAKLSLEENIIETKKCIEYARASGRDVLIEAELGNLGQSSKILDEIPEGVATSEEFLTSVEDAVHFVKETGVDLLAPAVGTMHGMLRSGAHPRINIDRVRDIRQATGIPLVLHGGSGSADEDFVDSIQAGISTVHINTEIRIAYRDAVRDFLQANPDEIAPYKILKSSVQAVENVVKERLKLFNGIK